MWQADKSESRYLGNSDRTLRSIIRKMLHEVNNEEISAKLSEMKITNYGQNEYYFARVINLQTIKQTLI